MAAPVWVLSVDLQAKTAAFSGNLKEAAAAARGSFNDMGSSAKAGTDEVKKGLFDVRHGLGLVDNVMRGQHAQAMADMVREFQNSSVVMTALPIAATVAGIALIGGIAFEAYEKIHKLREEEEKLHDDMTGLTTVIDNTFTGLDDKILQAQMEADNLSGDHLAALRNELILIDHQSLHELVSAFQTVEKAADTTFKDMADHWYTFGIGSAGAQHALQQLKVQYSELLAEGKDKEAFNLLYATAQQAQHVLNLQREAINSAHPVSTFLYGDYGKHKQAMDQLKQYGVGVTASEVQSQAALVQALDALLASTHKINELQHQQDHNAVARAHKSAGQANVPFVHVKPVTDPALSAKGMAAELLSIQQDSLARRQRQELEAGRETARHDAVMGEQRLAAEKEQYAREAASRRVSIAEQVRQQERLADELYTIQMGSLQQRILAADKSGQDRLGQLQALFNREQELTAQHENEITQIQDRAQMLRSKGLQQATAEELDTVNAGLVQSIMRHQTWGQMVMSIENQVVSTMISSALKHIEANAMTKQSDASAAARKMFNAGLKFPFPANIVMAPMLAAGAYATVMAYSQGTDMVNGAGRGDTVPAMLSPGEGVVPGGVMDGLRSVARRGGFEHSGQHHHYHDHRTFHIHALDQHGVRDVLEKHSAEFERHYRNTVRQKHS